MPLSAALNGTKIALNGTPVSFCTFMLHGLRDRFSLGTFATKQKQSQSALTYDLL